MNRAVFFDHVRRSPYAGSITPSQVAGIETILEAANQAHAWTEPTMIAYPLATAFWETGKTMKPIEEIGKGRGKAYGVPTGPWHHVYDGRGLVQLTWLANYTYATKALRAHGVIGADIDLVKNPELAMRPDIAGMILVFGMSEGWFTGHKLADYIMPGKNYVDYVSARRIINGTDRAVMIAGFARSFEQAIRAAA